MKSEQDTQLDIPANLLERITTIADETGLSPTEVIFELLQRGMKAYELDGKLGETQIEYKLTKTATTVH